jgi:CRP-like cAMP-binding protein
MEIPAGTALCREGEIGHEFFVIVDGKVEITRKGRKVAMRGSEGSLARSRCSSRRRGRRP